MKKLYMIGGPMGVGKTAVSRELQRLLPNCVFLDGDWCWDARPFQVTAETKRMVIRNICFLLDQFCHCSAYENIVFCWVMHEQDIIDAILAGIDRTDCGVELISLVCTPDVLRGRLEKDVQDGLRTSDVIERSLARLPLYGGLQTRKLGTDGVSAAAVAERIAGL